MPEPAKDQLAALKRAIAERQYDEAIRGARRLVLESAKHPEARVLLGEALLAAGRNDEARVEMLALVRERPEEPAAHRLLGEAHLRDGQLDPARASLRRAVELDPDDEAARDLLLEADSEVAAPSSSTVERWMGAAEPPTTEMQMPEYLQDAPPMASSASLRSLLEGAEPKKASKLVIPKPGSGAPAVSSLVTARMAPLAPAEPTTASISVEVDQEASTGEVRAPLVEQPTRGRPSSARPTAARQPGRPEAPRGIVEVADHRDDPTGEISLDDEIAPSPTMVQAERPRSAPPPVPNRTGSTSPGSVPAPSSARPTSRPPGPRPPQRTSTLLGVASPTPVGMAAPAAAPAPTNARASAAAPSGATPADPHSHGPRAVAAPPPKDRAGTASSTPDAALRAAAPRSVAPAPRSVAPTPLASSPTVITSADPGQGTAGALLPRDAVDNADMTIQRGAMSERGPAGPSAHGWSPVARPVIPAAAPPPKLGSYGPSIGGPAVGGPAVGGAPVAAAPMLGAQVGGARTAQPSGGVEPVTKPTIRAPGSGRTEATQRVRLKQFTVALVLGGIVAVALILGVTRWLDARARDEALAHASDDGAPADFLRALELTEGTPSTRARLFATATVELGEDRAARADELLAGETVASEARVARSLLALTRGQADQALVMLHELEASGVTLAEAHRAQALALDAVGRHTEAQAAARQAWTLRPAGSRHACLLARESLLAGDTATADTTLVSIGDGESRPCVRALRALSAWQRSDGATADAEASVVLGALAERATAGDLAWAHFVRGQVALARGDAASARSALRQAAQTAPSADETLLLRALDALVRADDAENARALAARLPTTAPSAARRAEVMVAIALELRDFAGAEAALRTLPEGARTELARARVLESQGQDEQALMHYATASADSAVAAEASVHRARLLSRLGRPREARAALESASRSAPTDPEIASTLAHAALAEGDPRAARSALEAAFRAHADDARLMAISALLRAADGERDPALALAQQAGAAAPNDPEVQLDLAEVARRVGDRALESRACAEALRLDSRRFAATFCVARSATEAGDFPRATQLLEDARQRGAPALELSRARADLMVAEGRGDVGVGLVRAFLQTHRSDVPLMSALARLQLQAEEGNAADATARQILARQAEHPEALYVRAYVAYVDGHFSTAADLLDRISRGAGAHGVTLALSARATALRGMLAYEDDRYGDPPALAEQALRADPRCGAAHLLRALIASRDRDAQRTALGAAVSGTDTPAEAIARLATSLGASPEGCALARRYVETAPEGYDRRDVEDVRSDCP